MEPVGTDVFAALASPARRDILRLLLDGPRPAGDLDSHFQMRRPSVSEHLRLLRNAGLVSERRSGRHRYYHLEAGRLAEVRDWIAPYERLLSGRPGGLRSLRDDQVTDA